MNEDENPGDSPRKKHMDTYSLMLIILFLAFMIRYVGITWESIWLDEAMTGLRSRMPLWDMIENISPKDHLPLYFTSMWLLEKIIGNSELALRLPSMILGALTVVPMYLIGSRISGRTGIIAAVLTAINPSLIYFSQEARMYAPMAFLAAFSIYFSTELVKPRRITMKKAVIGLIITNSLLFYLHYFSLVFIAVETLSIVAADLLLNPKKIRFKSFLKAIPNVTSFFVFLPWLLFILIRYPMSGHTTGGGLKLSFFLVYATYFFLGGAYSFYYDLEIGIILIAAISVLICGIFGIFLLFFRSIRDVEKRIMIIFVLPLLIIPTLSVYVVSVYWQSIYNYRYFIFMTPALIIAASFGIEKVREFVSAKRHGKRIYQLVVLLLVPLLLLGADALMMERDDKDDWRGATLFIEKNLGEDDIVLPQPAHQRYTMFYYAPDLPIRSISADPENVTGLFEAHDVIWIVTYHYRHLDYFGFRDLLENRTLEEIDDFSGLNMWRFSKQEGNL